METILIDGKEYRFEFNGNTITFFAQVFGEDLLALTFEAQKKKQILLENSRLQKLAYITNMQAECSGWSEVKKRISIDNYMDWCEGFKPGTWIAGTPATVILTGWANNLVTETESKNAGSQQ